MASLSMLHCLKGKRGWEYSFLSTIQIYFRGWENGLLKMFLRTYKLSQHGHGITWPQMQHFTLYTVDTVGMSSLDPRHPASKSRGGHGDATLSNPCRVTGRISFTSYASLPYDCKWPVLGTGSHRPSCHSVQESFLPPLSLFALRDPRSQLLIEIQRINTVLGRHTSPLTRLSNGQQKNERHHCTAYLRPVQCMFMPLQ